VINTERDYQDKKWPDGSPTQPHLPPSDFLRLIKQIARDADQKWYVTKDSVVCGIKVNPADMEALRKIAACAQRAIELFGCPPRPPVPTSN
jgi:hypothetical protein